ncbi:hypothetical protein [Halothermothrix orenii]|uniref:Uncharacterized protein n=1 Tax=Halothermothrix orenii (strain H 168 / OCM 544 / DSM 9562) TaxID=373903 RepID=B8CWX0_HALOH|nr:hypothetical protein [Halothermothrix orenii]ACL69789.1 hypothetical protein Hore_10330 [Halothermothrix orenii H 168]
MGGFLKKLERIFMTFLVITLILMVSVQILLKDDISRSKIKNIEMAIKNVIAPDRNTVPVSSIDNYKKEITEKKGYMVIDLLNNLKLPQVYLIKNGKRVANFKDGVVTVRVDNGDFLEIDARFYKSPLWFEITELSPSIKTWKPGQQFRVNGNEKKLGIVRFYEKL